MNCKRSILSAAVAAVGVMGVPTMAMSQTIGAAQSFAIVGGQTVTAAAGATQSAINGDVGVSPGTSITGFPAFAATLAPFSTHSNDGAAQGAQAATLSLYNTIAALGAGTALAPELSNQVIGPGTYSIGAANLASPGGAVSGNFTLSGAGLYIFKVASSLTANVNSRVTLVGVDPCQVYWQVTSARDAERRQFRRQRCRTGRSHRWDRCNAHRPGADDIARVCNHGRRNTVGGCSGGVAAPAPVPTLSESALIGLTLILGTGGVMAIRRRRA